MCSFLYNIQGDLFAVKFSFVYTCKPIVYKMKKLILCTTTKMYHHLICVVNWENDMNFWHGYLNIIILLNTNKSEFKKWDKLSHLPQYIHRSSSIIFHLYNFDLQGIIWVFCKEMFDVVCNLEKAAERNYRYRAKNGNSDSHFPMAAGVWLIYILYLNI